MDETTITIEDLATTADIERATNLKGYRPRVWFSYREGVGDFRRPFRHKGAWCIRCQGTAALLKPYKQNGFLTFPVTYWWPTD